MEEGTAYPKYCRLPPLSSCKADVIKITKKGDWIMKHESFLHGLAFALKMISLKVSPL